MIDGGNIMNCIILHISGKKTLSSLLKDRNGFYQFGFGFETNMLSRTTLISTSSLSPNFDHFGSSFFAIFFSRRRRHSSPGSPPAACAPATKSPLAPPSLGPCCSRHWIDTWRSWLVDDSLGISHDFTMMF